MVEVREARGGRIIIIRWDDLTEEAQKKIAELIKSKPRLATLKVTPISIILI